MERKCPFGEPVCNKACALRDGDKTCLDRVVEALKVLEPKPVQVVTARKG